MCDDIFCPYSSCGGACGDSDTAKEKLGSVAYKTYTLSRDKILDDYFNTCHHEKFYSEDLLEEVFTFDTLGEAFEKLRKIKTITSKVKMLKN